MVSDRETEQRILASAHFGSRSILSVVLTGDAWLTERLRREKLLPPGSPIRVRLVMEYVAREELRACLEHLFETAVGCFTPAQHAGSGLV